MKRYFGTDGIRGRVGDIPIQPEWVLKLGWALGKVLSEVNGTRKVLIGKDTRISGYMFESAMEAGLSAAGVNSLLLGPMPTPGIAYLTRTLRAEAGIVISASHNPYYDNGIKVFSGDGTKLPDSLEDKIEYYLSQPLELVESARLGKASRVSDAVGRYIEFCKSTIPPSRSLSGLKIVVDCANGATYHIAPNVFRELGADVIEMGCRPNGLNINQGCGSTHPEALQQKVIAENADLGIALDGDGDRVIMVDHKGELVDGDELLYLIVQNRIDRQRPVPGVVGTLMSNLGLEKTLKDKGIPFYRSAVGDRYVMQALKERGWSVGGESSGHIVCLDLTTTGDGIISALQVLRSLVRNEQTLHEAKKSLMKYPQILKNVAVHSDKSKILNSAEVKGAIFQAESQLGAKGRLLVRASGTEPLVRVMVEGEDDSQIQFIASSITQVIESQILNEA